MNSTPDPSAELIQQREEIDELKRMFISATSGGEHRFQRQRRGKPDIKTTSHAKSVSDPTKPLQLAAKEMPECLASAESVHTMQELDRAIYAAIPRICNSIVI